MQYEDIPYGYAHCYATDGQCPQCGHCLRHHAAEMNEALARPHDQLCCVTPAYVTKVAGGEPCAYYRSDKPLRYAQGMKGLFDQVPKKLYSTVRARVMGCFSCERNFYYAQNGTQFISPALQQRILRIFEQAGLPVPSFDTYVMRPAWEA